MLANVTISEWRKIELVPFPSRTESTPRRQTDNERPTCDDSIGQRILRKLVDPFMITTLINGIGTGLCHFVFGMPVDPKIVIAFQTVGMVVGTGYGPTKEMIKRAIGDDGVACSAKIVSA